MEIALFLFFILWTAIFLFTWRKQNNLWKSLSIKEHPFKCVYPLADWLLQKKILKDTSNQKIQENFKALYVQQNIQTEYTLYQLKRISIFYVCLWLCAGSALLYEVRHNQMKETKELRRPGYGQSPGKVELEVEGMKEAGTIEFRLDAQTYSEQELDTLFQQIHQEMLLHMLGENESLEKIKSNLVFPDDTGCPGIAIRWIPEDNRFISSHGELHFNQVDPQGKQTTVIMELLYGEQKAQYPLRLTILPQTNTTNPLKELEQIMESEQQHNRDRDYFQLPQSYHGRALRFYEPLKGIHSLSLLACGLLFAIALWYLPNEKVKEKMKRRERQLALDYAEIVMKLTILTGAGLAVRGAWERIIKDYEAMGKEQSGFRYAYEEMKVTYRSIQRGEAEGRAYRDFGKRCGTHCYLKLGNLLEQNIKKGSKGLTSALNHEMILAFEEQKHLARRMGEEAGTKLLAPVFLFLLIVLIVLLAPAFLTLSI